MPSSIGIAIRTFHVPTFLSPTVSFFKYHFYYSIYKFTITLYFIYTFFLVVAFKAFRKMKMNAQPAYQIIRNYWIL